MIRWLARFCALALLAWGLGFFAFVMALPGPAGAVRTDGVIVLTGGEGRVTRGLDVLRHGLARRMLISGVEPSVRAAELANLYRVPPRIFACCIDLDRQAVDTRSNVVESWRWARLHRYHSVRLVTTDWHMARAKLELAQAADGPLRIVPDATVSAASLGVYFREYNKYVLRLAATLIGM